MKISIGQINPTVADLEGNVAQYLAAVEAGAANGADLIILPELAIPGAHPQDILYDASFIDAVQAATQDLADQCKDLSPVILGSVTPTNPSDPLASTLYNSALFIHNGIVTQITGKQVLPIGDIAYEPRWFVSGLPSSPLTIAGKKFGVLFADDLDQPEIAQQLRLAGADWLVILAAQPFQQNTQDKRVKKLASLGQNIIFANLCGGNDGLIYDGRSMVLNAGGEILAQAKSFSTDLLHLDLDTLMPLVETESPHPYAELLEVLTVGVRDFMQKNALPHIHLGLSGGIDSAVVACIATNAVGKENVTGITMPSRFSDDRSAESARQLAENLGIEFKTVPIHTLHEAGEALLGDIFTGTAAENWQARVRMMILMTHVNAKGGILLGTGNKTEFSFGYATLYGDLAGAMAPIGDLIKPQVYALARWINRDTEIIPNFTLDRKPSAELRPEQVDPFNYPVEAPKIEAMIQKHRSPAPVTASEHKRQQAGIVLRVSAKAFGGGRMVPITRK